MGRASDLIIRGVFLPWSDWNIEGPPYVDLPLEERAQLVFSTLFGNGPNGVRAVPVTQSGYLINRPHPSSALFQSIGNAINALVIPAPGPTLRNILTGVSWEINGTGAAPTQAAPVIVQILDGVALIYQSNATGFNGGTVGPTNYPNGGLRGSLNTPMTIQLSAPGVNNSTLINAQYITE